MDDSEATSLEQIRAFLAGSSEVRFAGERREEVYEWMEQTLVRLQYASLKRPGKGLVRSYITRMTGLSRAQATRLIMAYRETGRVKATAYLRTQFATQYTAADVALLAYVDKAQQTHRFDQRCLVVVADQGWHNNFKWRTITGGWVKFKCDVLRPTALRSGALSR